MKHDKSKIKHKPKGASPSKVSTQSNRPSHPSSSSRKMSLRKNIVVGESNEGCLGGGDGEDPPQGNIKKSHALDHPQKRRKGKKSPKYS